MLDSHAPESPRTSLLPPEARDNLDILTPDDLDRLARGAACSLLAGRLLLGRCLVEIDRRNLDAQWGYSGPVHYAVQALKVAKWEAKEALRVARRLRSLPLLSQAAEAGEIGWAALREVVRVASAETEDLWLQAAQTRTMAKLQRLVARSSRGRAPVESCDEGPARPDRVEFRFWTTPEEAELLNAAVATLSVQAERKLDLGEAITAMAFLVRQDHLRTSPRRLAAAEREVQELRQVRERQDERDWESVEREVEAARQAQGGEGSTRVPSAPPPELADGSPSGEEPTTEGPTWVPDLQEEPHLAVRPNLPWAAAAVVETPCPGEPDLVLATKARVPHWEEKACGSGPDCQHSRKRRVPRRTRKHVLRRDGFQCACPGCPNRVWVDLHHVVFFCRGGLTTPPNLCLTCSKCHANIHKDRLHVRGNAEVALKWTDAWGRSLGETSPRRRRQAVEVARRLLARSTGMARSHVPMEDRPV